MTESGQTPEDWGSDTLARFRYQAEVTVPFCLAAALGAEDIVEVVPEHLEDIALRHRTGWRYLQVKSRNPERGLWTLSDLVCRGGALRSLYRTHLFTNESHAPLELILEGAHKTNDVIQEFLPGGDRSGLEPRVAESLGIELSDAARFLARVVLNAPPAPREYVSAANRDLIHSHAQHLTGAAVRHLHRELLQEIERAMRCDRLGAFWPRAISHPATRSDVAELRLASKTLTADRLRAILRPLSPEPRPVLRRMVETGSRAFSSLERKMVDGGATPAVIEQARLLAADARYHRFSREAQTIEPDTAKREDLHRRIEVHATAKGALHGQASRPAVGIWDDLLQTFESHAESIDQHNLVERDPMLLLGEACGLSDECRFGWGLSNV